MSNEIYNHDEREHYRDAIMNEIKSAFKDLANLDLLQKCLHSSIHNANESVNAVVDMPSKNIICSNNFW